MKVWFKYIGWYEDCSIDAVMTEEAMLNDKQSYYLEATVKLSKDIKYLTDKVELAKKERQPYIRECVRDDVEKAYADIEKGMVICFCTKTGMKMTKKMKENDF